jgi:hypothetical protein
MNNSTNFTGNSVFGQLISLIPAYQVQRVVKKYQSDKFTKAFLDLGTSGLDVVCNCFCIDPLIFGQNGVKI